MRHLYSFRRLALLGLILVIGQSAYAQGFTIGADLVSRYVWRGFEFGESASIQPSLAYGFGGTEIGTWASYSLVPDGGLANEHDLWLSHTIVAGGSSVTLGLTSYYFPNAGADIFDLDGGGEGAHYVEPFVSYEGDSSFPIRLSVAAIVYNDPNHSAYLEAGYPFEVAGTELEMTVGFIPAASGFYGTESAAFTNLSLSASRNLPISDQFALPLFVTYTLNPYAERSYLVFGVSIGN